jgi:predicted lactoylglutathione lyase
LLLTDETAACMLVGEHAFVMLLSREKFAEFSKLPIADPTTHTLALYCFSVSSRDEVDTVSAAALAAGASEADDAEDYGFMYSRSFFDLDGHGWQVMWMDPAAAEQGPDAFAASMQDAEAPARPFPGIGETLLGEDDQHRGCVGVLDDVGPIGRGER